MISTKKLVLTSVALVATLSLAACAPAATPSPTTSQSKSADPAKEYETAPLTGIQFEKGTNAFINGPVVMAKIDNSFDARPHAGLSQTDIVYEELVEGGITRLLAIWQSQFPAQVGPVRSVRPMDPDIASPFGGIIAYSGGQVRFVQKMRKTEVYNASETSEQSKKTMVRVKDRVAPHNLFLLPEKIQSQHLKRKAPAAWQSFTTDQTKVSAASGTEVAKATARFPGTKAVWTYNAEKAVFERSQDGVKAVDANNNERVSAVNLIMIYVDIDRSEPDPIYGNVPRTVVNGTGTGKYLNGGKVIDIKWSKKDRTSPQVFTTTDGTPITMAAGNTWVELVPTDAKGKIIVE